MTYEEAIKLLHPNTSREAIAELEYYNGFNKNKTIDTINEAIELVCEAAEKQIPKKPIPHIVEVDSIKIRNGIWRKGTTVYKCPNCGNWLSRIDDNCNKCGQKIEWEE